MLATTHRRARFVPALLLAAAAALPASAALATPLAGAVDLGDACTDPTGVTVVVDATELAGDVTVGCAADPATGTEALAQAGISETRDPSGLICAIGDLPDPCPTEFTGSYWTYWTAAPGGEWTSYAEGPDTAAPGAGTVEGWRYGDGTQPPGVAPADVLPGGAGGEAEDEATDAAESGSAEAAGATATAPEEGEDADGPGDGMSLWVGAAVGIAVVGGLVGLIVRLRRQSRDLQQD